MLADAIRRRRSTNSCAIAAPCSGASAPCRWACCCSTWRWTPICSCSNPACAIVAAGRRIDLGQQILAAMGLARIVLLPDILRRRRRGAVRRRISLGNLAAADAAQFPRQSAGRQIRWSMPWPVPPAWRRWRLAAVLQCALRRRAERQRPEPAGCRICSPGGLGVFRWPPGPSCWCWAPWPRWWRWPAAP